MKKLIISMGPGIKARRWLRRSFPGLYKRYGKYFHRQYKLGRRILRHAKLYPGLYADAELTAAVEYLSRNGVSVFSYPGCEKYDSLPVEVRVDGDGFPWVEHNGRRLYFRRYDDPVRVADYYRGLLKEQDAASPHCYDHEGSGFREGDVLFDVGSAEGMFALDNVEKAARVFLFEVAPAWMGALERTFAPWRDKVTIINKYVSDTDGENTVTADTVVRDCALDKPLFLKMDVEGAEESVLKGASEVLARRDTRAVICTYHRQGDYTRLSVTMRGKGFDVETSAGYMLFVFDMKMSSPFFRRGLIYCKR